MWAALVIGGSMYPVVRLTIEYPFVTVEGAEVALQEVERDPRALSADRVRAEVVMRADDDLPDAEDDEEATDA